MANTNPQPRATKKKASDAAATVAEKTSGTKTKAFKVAKREFDPTQLVPVINGFQGRLIYVSKRQNGVQTQWDEFGQEEYLELAELISARNTHRAFFEENLWIIEDPEILEFLGVDRYYKNSLHIHEFDELLSKNASEMDDVVAVIRELPEGQKRTLAYRAKQKIADGAIDSIKMIDALETALGFALTEK